ncbi:MAG: hypothetical protein ACREEE_15255, partial [Dongiaceae bacterium]
EVRSGDHRAHRQAQRLDGQISDFAQVHFRLLCFRIGIVWLPLQYWHRRTATEVTGITVL